MLAGSNVTEENGVAAPMLPRASRCRWGVSVRSESDAEAEALMDPFTRMCGVPVPMSLSERSGVPGLGKSVAEGVAMTLPSNQRSSQQCRSGCRLQNRHRHRCWDQAEGYGGSGGESADGHRTDCRRSSLW